MLEYHCEACGKTVQNIPKSYAGRSLKCPSCKTPGKVPAQEEPAGAGLDLEDDEPHADYDLDEAADAPAPASAGNALASSRPVEAKTCPSCGKAASQQAVMCVQCGTNLTTGQSMRTRQPSSSGAGVGAAGMIGLGMLGALAGATIGGVLWALVAYFTHMELGILAWGIGLLSGGGLVMFTQERSGLLGFIAAAAALFGLLLGKYLIVFMVLSGSIVPEGQEGFNLNEAMALDLPTVVEIEMMENQEFSPEVQTWLDNQGEAFGREDFDIEAYMAESEKMREKIDQEVQARIDQMSDEEKDGLMAEHGVDNTTGTIVIAIASLFAVPFSFGLFDLLWLFLALGSAFKMGTTAPTAG